MENTSALTRTFKKTLCKPWIRRFPLVTKDSIEIIYIKYFRELSCVLLKKKVQVNFFKDFLEKDTSKSTEKDSKQSEINQADFEYPFTLNSSFSLKIIFCTTQFPYRWALFTFSIRTDADIILVSLSFWHLYVSSDSPFASCLFWPPKNSCWYYFPLLSRINENHEVFHHS